MIGLDYTAGPGHAPGVGRYVRELVRALVRLEGPPLKLIEVGRAPVPMEGAPLGLEGLGVVRNVQRSRWRIPRRALFAQERFGDPLGVLAARGCRLVHRVDPALAARGAGPLRHQHRGVPPCQVRRRIKRSDALRAPPLE